MNADVTTRRVCRVSIFVLTETHCTNVPVNSKTAQIICVSLLKFENSASFLLKKHLVFPSPPNTMLKIKGIYRYMYRLFSTLYGGGGWSQAGGVVFSSEVCAKMPKVQICPKALVHDCISKPSWFTDWLVLSPPSAGASNGQGLHQVWCSLWVLFCFCFFSS